MRLGTGMIIGGFQASLTTTRHDKEGCNLYASFFRQNKSLKIKLPEAHPLETKRTNIPRYALTEFDFQPDSRIGTITFKQTTQPVSAHKIFRCYSCRGN